MPKIIAIANQKGGVGKTTTSINLSACIAERGKRTLLLDMDPQGNSTSGLGINKKQIKSSIYDLLINNASIQDIITPTPCDNLHLCPSNIKLAGAEIELVAVMSREYCLKEAVAEVLDKYDYIFIDCPPSFGLLTINALTCAQTVIIPIQCEYYALEGLSELTSTIKKIKKATNPELDIEGVLLTMFDARTNLSIQVVEEVKKFFVGKVYKTVIPRNVRLSEAPSYGEPIIKYDERSRGAECYRELAGELLINSGGDDECQSKH